MELEYEYESLDAVPEAFRPLFTENEGKFVISNIKGLKPQKEFDTISEALRKERNDRAAANRALDPWRNMNHEEVMAKLARIEELEAAAAGKLDDDKINGMVEKRLAQKVSPLEREKVELTNKNSELAKEIENLKSSIYRRDLNDSVRGVAIEMKVQPTAIPDIEMIASNYFERDEVGNFIVKAGMNGITPGLDVKGFMREMQKQRPHWWPQSAGGGANGGGASFGGERNPWSRQNWNLTEQGRVIREQGFAVAEQMAQAVGSKIGATQPPAQNK